MPLRLTPALSSANSGKRARKDERFVERMTDFTDTDAL
jgi:hypothetical protein